LGGEDEGGEEWAEIGGEDHETGPDVDFSAEEEVRMKDSGKKQWSGLRVFVEEEYIFDEHEPALFHPLVGEEIVQKAGLTP